MFARFAVILALGAMVSAPAPISYRIEQKTESKVDLSVFGQGEQIQNQDVTWFVTLAYTDSAGGRVVHAVLDSLRTQGGMIPVSPAALDSAKGTTYHGYQDGEWKLRSLTASKASTLGVQFEATLRLLHPSIKRGAAAGARWTDTLDVTTKTDQANLSANTVRNFVMGGAETFEGTAATRLNVEMFTSIKGTLETPGGSAEMAGSGPGTGAFYLASDGRFVGGTSSSNIDALVTLASAPAPIPVKTTTTTTVSVLK